VFFPYELNSRDGSCASIARAIFLSRNFAADRSVAPRSPIRSALIFDVLLRINGRPERARTVDLHRVNLEGWNSDDTQ
jgi:hypothetical protein